jgi:hypothetical protein
MWHRSIMVAWIEVLTTIVDGPKAPVQGIISRSGPIDTGRLLMSGIDEVMPLYVGGVDDLQVWRDEPRVRVESMTGEPLVIFDGEDVWRFAHHEDLPVRAPARSVSYAGPGRELLVTQPASRWVGNDFTTPDKPIEEIEYLGRACWAVELRPPKHKPHAMQLVVDKRTGTILQQRNDGFGTAVSFIEFTAGIPIDPAMFEWTGPLRQPGFTPRHDDYRSSFIPSQGEQKDQHQGWFAEHVSDRPLEVPLLVDLSVQRLRYRDDDGAFEANIGGGAVGGRLARRPRSSTTWHLQWQTTAIRAWSTEHHDWAIALHTGLIDDHALGVLQQQLHPDQAPVGEPDIA